MFIHIGDRKMVSDRDCIGIFSVESLRMSEENRWILEKIDAEAKVVALDAQNGIVWSGVSPFTVIKRTSIANECMWRRKNDQEL